MSGAAETGATFAVRDGPTKSLHTGPDRARPRRLEPRLRVRLRAGLRRRHAAGTYPISVTGPRRRPRRRSGSTPAPRLRGRARPTRSTSTRCSATARLRPVGAARRGGAPQRRERDDLPDAAGEQQRRVLGRPVAARHPDGRVRRLVRRRRLPQVPPDHELHVAMLLAGVRDFPRRWAPVHRRPSDFTAEAKFGADWLLQDVGRPEPHALLPGRHRQREREDARRPRHLAAAAGRRHVRRQRPGLPLHPQPAGLPRRRRPARRSARTSRAATAAALRAVLPGLQDDATRRSPTAACSPPSTSSTWPTRRPGSLLTVIPFSFYPEDEWRDDLELGADRALLRARRAAACPPACRTPTRRSTCRRRRTGRTPTSRARTTPPTRSTCTTSAASRTTSCTGRSTQAGNPGGLETTQAALRRRPQEAARRRGRAGGDRPVPVRVPVGDVGHDVARRRAVGDGEHVRRAHRHHDVRRLERPLAGEHPRRQRVGRVADHRQRHDVPALPAAPGRQPRRLARRLAAGARRAPRSRARTARSTRAR